MPDTALNDFAPEWQEVIKPRRSLFYLNFKEVWQYRDLLFMFVRRDYAASYQQTIIGPLWHFIQPIFTTLVFVFVFGNIAKIGTDGQPRVLFYLSGLVLWNYFSDCFFRTSNVFVSQAGIFGKVYFPRLVTPLSFAISSLMRFASQFLLFLIILIYFIITKPTIVHPSFLLLLTPVLILLTAGIAIGGGMIVSSITTKYRDIGVLISFFISLLMYGSCIIYPLSYVPKQFQKLVLLNPLSSIIESFRYGFLGTGHFSWLGLGYSFVWMLVLLFSGIILFNKVERTFMDTV